MLDGELDGVRLGVLEGVGVHDKLDPAEGEPVLLGVTVTEGVPEPVPEGEFEEVTEAVGELEDVGVYVVVPDLVLDIVVLLVDELVLLALGVAVVE